MTYDMSGIRVREYTSSDAQATLSVFLAAVTLTAKNDYSPEQIAAWARPERRVLAEWDHSRSQGVTVVATDEHHVCGFGQLTGAGHIEMMFTHPGHTRRGVASALLAELEAVAYRQGHRELTSDVSLTAREFFAQHDFEVIAEQCPVLGEVQLCNFLMLKTLAV